MTVRYLTGVSNTPTRAAARERTDLGLLITPDTAAQYTPHIASYPFWAADNACFNHPETFSTDKFLGWLATFTPEQRAACLWAVAPDVVGDPVRTIARSIPVLPLIRALGYRAAFVAQDGLETMAVPWDEFDALFIGGSTQWKLSPQARCLAFQAWARGKLVHMGRVNSLKRLRIAQSFGCDTADGTYLAFGPDKNLPKLLTWLDQIAKENT